jgi:hypothetical protein
MVMTRLMLAFTVLILSGRIAEFRTPPCGDPSILALFPSACRALLGVLSGPVLELVGGTLLFSPQADGGGDGGDGGDGGAGSSGDGSTGGDSGTGEGNGGDSGDDGDGSGAAPGNTEDAPANDDEAPTDPPAVTDPTDPTSELDVAKSDPVGSPGIAAFPTVPSGLVPEVDVGINAVIVSGARTPWEAIGKSSGVRYVMVTGGIIALGEAALVKPPPVVGAGTTEPPPEWLKFKPDSRYLNGSVFPPVVPNVIDIRTISSSEEVVEGPSN